MRMKVSRENQKRSSIRWMGCKPKKVSINKQDVWQNAKLKEEMDDVEIQSFDENDYFEEEADIITSASNSFRIKYFKHLLLLIFSFNFFYAKFYLQ